MSQPLNAAAKAFALFSRGHFANGLELLRQDPFWSDNSSALDGPFVLEFSHPTRRWGIGEALLVASLLKRQAMETRSTIGVWGGSQLRALLRHDPSFELRDPGLLGRSPYAILKAALVGTLLNKTFHPLIVNTDASASLRPQLGIAWASINTTTRQPTLNKSVPLERFRTLLEQLPSDVELVSFQRSYAGRAAAASELSERWSYRQIPDEQLEAVDQSKVLSELRPLSGLLTVSTTTAHLAAAIGKLVVLLAANRIGPQWFWLAQANYDRRLYPSLAPVIGGPEGGEWWEPCMGAAAPLVRRLFSADRAPA